MNVVIFGGSGFIGRKLMETLYYEGHQVVSISRSGKPHDEHSDWSQSVEWVKSDLLNDTLWQTSTAEADWIIDAIGILFENPKKSLTYERLIVQPVQILTNYLTEHSSKARLLFLSANHAPFFLQNYMAAKKVAEKLVLKQQSGNRILYPSLVIDSARPFSVISGAFLSFTKKIPGLRFFSKPYDPMTRQQLANEVITILAEKDSRFAHRRES